MIYNHDEAEALAELQAENRHLRETLKEVLRRQRKLDAVMLRMVALIREVSGLDS